MVRGKRKMIIHERDCVNCGLPCIGRNCGYYNNIHYFCDECEEEKQLYEFNGQQLCIDCIMLQLDKVN